jgi:hypothetical protein
MEEHLELILHYMYWSKRFQFLFREAAFYYKNPGMEASGSEQGTLAGVLMHHIAMIRSMNKVILKGIAHVDRRFLLACYVDETETAEIDLEIDRSVRELMMEKQAAGTKIWILIAHLQDGQWAGFYRSGLHGGQDDSILSAIQAKSRSKSGHQRNSCQILQNRATESRRACTELVPKL